MTKHAQRKAQKRNPEKTLSIYLRLTRGTERGYSNQPHPVPQKKTINKNSTKQQTLRKGKSVISIVATLLDSNVQCSATTKNHKALNKTKQENMAHSKENNKSVTNVLEKDLVEIY